MRFSSLSILLISIIAGCSEDITPSGSANHPPVLAEIGDYEIDEGSGLTILLQADDPDSDSLSFEAKNLPFGAVLEKDLFAWTPDYDQAGVYENITFRVWDDGTPGMSDEEVIVITVNNVNRPPVLE